MKRKYILLFLVIVSLFLFSGCAADSTLTAVSAEEPEIRVYNTTSNETSVMQLEDYVAGVVAGEVYNSWNMEALKTQCVLSRTYALKFAMDNPELYKEKGISTNIADAQNYDETTINERILEACKATRGEIITHKGEIINAYFHSNSGGQTVTSSEGFYNGNNIPYIKSVSSPETANNSKNYSWSVTFSKGEVLQALSKMGVSLSNISSVSLGEKTENGHYKTVKIGGKSINAISLRNNLGTTKMKSTKLTNISVNDSGVTISGLGYGHGVGVSQWGAKILGDSGKNYKEILDYYFNDINITTLY